MTFIYIFSRRNVFIYLFFLSKKRTAIKIWFWKLIIKGSEGEESKNRVGTFSLLSFLTAGPQSYASRRWRFLSTQVRDDRNRNRRTRISAAGFRPSSRSRRWRQPRRSYRHRKIASYYFLQRFVCPSSSSSFQNKWIKTYLLRFKCSHGGW